MSLLRLEISEHLDAHKTVRMCGEPLHIYLATPCASQCIGVRQSTLLANCSGAHLQKQFNPIFWLVPSACRLSHDLGLSVGMRIGASKRIHLNWGVIDASKTFCLDTFNIKNHLYEVACHQRQSKLWFAC
jgi:hypothetical protein